MTILFQTPLGPEGPDLTRYALVCIILLAAICALAWGFKRMFAGALERRANRRSLSVLDVLPVGGKQKLMVVRCYDRTFLLGAGDGGLQSIAELDPETGEDADGDEDKGTPFRDLLSRSPETKSLFGNERGLIG